MQIVTITTDLGQSDYYLGALKGALLTNCIDIQLVDIATGIAHYNIKQASYVLRNAYPYFPKGTIHIMNINAAETAGRMLCIKHQDHYFIVFDNGCVPLIFGSVPTDTYVVNEDIAESSSLLYTEGLSNVINALMHNLGLPKIGSLTHQVKENRWMLPQSAPGMIKGTVQYIDQYGNAITNITREVYDQCIGERKIKVQFGMYEIYELSRDYADDKKGGDALCFFNAEGKLEIALNKYIAANMLSLKLDTSSILIEAIN